MGKRKRQNDKKEEELYRPDFTRSMQSNAETDMMLKEMDADLRHSDDDQIDLRVQNRNTRELRFSSNDTFVPKSYQRRAVEKAQEFEEHLRDHALFFQSMTHKEVSFDQMQSASKQLQQQKEIQMLKEPKAKRQKLNHKESSEEQEQEQQLDSSVKTGDVIHVNLRGLAKTVSEPQFRKMMGSINFHNLRMNIGKNRLTKFVLIGRDDFNKCRKMLHGKKLYGKRLQLWEKKNDTSFSNTTRYIYVGNLPPSTNAAQVGAHLLPCGKIRSVTMVPKKMCCFVRFKHRSSVKKALEMDNFFLNGFYLRISEEKNLDDLVLDKFNESAANLNYDSEDFDEED